MRRRQQFIAGRFASGPVREGFTGLEYEQRVGTSVEASVSPPIRGAITGC